LHGGYNRSEIDVEIGNVNECAQIRRKKIVLCFMLY
jgi:hypothetical protein